MSVLTVCCHTCNRQHSFDCDNFHWEAVSSNEQQMGAETQHAADQEAQCQCGNFIRVELECWEYPMAVINMTDIQVTGADVVANDCVPCPDLSDQHEWVE